MSSTYYYGVAGASVLLWAPILFNFLRQWRRRRNPVSLAIASMVLLIMWWAVTGIWLISGRIDSDTEVFATAGASILTACCVHLAFYRSKTRFHDQRKEPR